MKVQIKTMKTSRFQTFICSHRAQIKMFETIAILVVFFMILLFGFIFYTKIQKITFQSELEQSTVLKAVEISQKIAFLPEIQCSKGKNIPEKDCIDLFKLKAVFNVINSSRTDYFDSMEYSHVYVEKIYPEELQTSSWNIYDFPRSQNKGKISTQFPISLKDPTTNTYSFGVLYVDVYR